MSRGERTKARLLDAALRVHAREGHEGFTVHAVVAESGVSLGSLYHHFGSWDGLAAALYARCLGALLDAVVRGVVSRVAARAGIVALVRSYLRYTKTHPASARFVHASSYAAFLPAHRAIVAAAIEPRLARLDGWLAPHVAAGRVVSLPPALFEVLVLGPAAEAARRWLAGAPDLDLDEAMRVLPEHTWRAVRRPSRAHAAPRSA